MLLLRALLKAFPEKFTFIAQIKALTPTIITPSPEATIKVTHNLTCSMIDGKVCSALTGISTMRCIVCGAYPSAFNHVDKLSKRTANKATYEFGCHPFIAISG